MKVIERRISELKPAEYNPRQLTDKQFKDIKKSLDKFGFVDPVVINMSDARKNIIIGGHQRVKVWSDMGNDTVPSVELELSFKDEQELNVRLNKNTGGWDFDILANYFEKDDLLGWGFESFELDFNSDCDGSGTGKEEGEKHAKLTEKFLIPPFTILDTRQGYWKDRRQFWRECIGDDGESRKQTLSESELMSGINDGVSLFDPVLLELIARWFAFPEAKIIDPFNGGSEKHYVFSALNCFYTGIELRKEQHEINLGAIEKHGLKSVCICDDGQNVTKHVQANSQDLLFSCPPYWNLEVYSDLPNDASNQGSYSDFMAIIRTAFTEAAKTLKNNRFAVIVVGDVRDKQGFYCGFVDDIKSIFKAIGMPLYNEMILVEPLGTLPQRVGRYMKSRKIGKCHQNVLVFYKGDPKQISKIYPEIVVNAEENEGLE